MKFLMKKISKFLLTFLLVLFIALPLITQTNNANAAPTCASGDGCRPTCIAEGLPADPDCNPATCSVSGSGGLIPCGKSCDDPDTGWTETEPCNLCSMILMSQLIIQFLLKISAVAALIAIVFGGFLYMFAVGNQQTIEKAKTMIKYVLIGFVIVFIAWAIVDSILVLFGYIDPIGGEWYTINC
ncbi:MAG: pilin [Patescibacteria group bacterium]|nr:pilin [Patescibacteria group bacterium]